ncbi:MAG: hypothetical protein KatS3mg005_3576 [Bryobacteraceae bacterium]|nr:MAG: hypothetical protein KatS3mg005_3576 [Bryobacteraceae bacterium]
MTPHSISPRDRVFWSLRGEPPDRTPRDFAAVPEIWSRLMVRFGVPDRESVLQRLGVDLRIVSYDSFCRPPDVPEEEVNPDASLERSSTGAMWRRVLADGSNVDIWGAHRRRVQHAFGAFEEFASYPLGSAVHLDDVRSYRFPEPDWWDFSPLRSVLESMLAQTRYCVRYRVGSVFETAWSLCGFERFMTDLADGSPIPGYIMERITAVHEANLECVLTLAGGWIDIVYFYDDLASQTGLLMSPAMYARHVQPFHRRLIAIARRYGKPVMMHSCGAVARLIPALIDMGVSILNPVQPRARGMAPETLAREFGGRIVFHGGIDVQQLLPRATPEQVRREVKRVAELLGPGYIRAGAHHIQADTPVDNILAMYEEP